MLQQQNNETVNKKLNGSKFVVWFIIVSAITSVLICYAIYKSYMSRPNIKIEDEKK